MLHTNRSAVYLGLLKPCSIPPEHEGVDIRIVHIVSTVGNDQVPVSAGGLECNHITSPHGRNGLELQQNGSGALV